MAFEELEQRQSVMWGKGPIRLDLACGTGAVAERAAAAGTRVTGLAR